MVASYLHTLEPRDGLKNILLAMVVGKAALSSLFLTSFHGALTRVGAFSESIFGSSLSFSAWVARARRQSAFRTYVEEKTCSGWICYTLQQQRQKNKNVR